jgi:hypothetical protein
MKMIGELIKIAQTGDGGVRDLMPLRRPGDIGKYAEGLRTANSNPHAFLLFEEFTQAEAATATATAQGFGGTGLDLAITRKLAR